MNRQARHEYFVEETLEAGIELFGTEVKSMRCGGVNLKDAWCDFEGMELFVPWSSPVRRQPLIRPRKQQYDCRLLLKVAHRFRRGL